VPEVEESQHLLESKSVDDVKQLLKVGESTKNHLQKGGHLPGFLPSVAIHEGQLFSDKMGGENRRMIFNMLVIFHGALVVYCLVRDSIALIILLRGFFCTKKKPTASLDIEQTEDNDASTETAPEDIV
jgi:hypothetical protein